MGRTAPEDAAVLMVRHKALRRQKTKSSFSRSGERVGRRRPALSLCVKLSTRGQETSRIFAARTLKDTQDQQFSFRHGSCSSTRDEFPLVQMERAMNEENNVESPSPMQGYRAAAVIAVLALC